MAPSSQHKSVQSIDRAVSILRLLAEPPTAAGNSTDGIALGAVAKAVGLSPSTTHRIMRTLVELHMAQQDANTKRYRLGPLTGVLGRTYLASAGLERAQPILRKMCVATNESVSLALLQNGAAHVVLQEHSTQALRVDHLAGTELSLHASAMGKVLIAFSDAPLAESLNENSSLQSFTNSTIVEPNALLSELEKIRHQSFATNIGERYEGANGVAVPVFGPNHSVRLARGIQGPSTRLSPARMAELVKICHSAALEIADLGLSVA